MWHAEIGLFIDARRFIPKHRTSSLGNIFYSFHPCFPYPFEVTTPVHPMEYEWTADHDGGCSHRSIPLAVVEW
jgi:hypothetical protein